MKININYWEEYRDEYEDSKRYYMELKCVRVEGFDERRVVLEADEYSELLSADNIAKLCGLYDYRLRVRVNNDIVGFYYGEELCGTVKACEYSGLDELSYSITGVLHQLNDVYTMANKLKLTLKSFEEEVEI